MCVVCNGSGAAELEFKDGSIALVCSDCGNPNAKRPRGRPPRFYQTRFRMAGMEHPSMSTLGQLGSHTTTTVCRRTAVNRRYAEKVMDLFMIREWRLRVHDTIRPVLEKHPADQGDAFGLALILVHAIERYQTRYPKTTLTQIVGALQNAADAFSENDEPGEADTSN